MLGVEPHGLKGISPFRQPGFARKLDSLSTRTRISDPIRYLNPANSPYS